MRGRDGPTSAIPDGYAASAIPPQFAHTESSAGLAREEGPPCIAAADFDRRAIKELLADMAADPDGAMEYLYARLFIAHPQLRGLFPHAMTQTRAVVFRELTALIGGLDDRQRTERCLAQVGGPPPQVRRPGQALPAVLRRDRGDGRARRRAVLDDRGGCRLAGRDGLVRGGDGGGRRGGR